ncbi:MAG: site-specific DNA-methyltransferase [bacterium]|nr:site-specific DNA-methyltransferase [bacterium]
MEFIWPGKRSVEVKGGYSLQPIDLPEIGVNGLQLSLPAAPKLSGEGGPAAQTDPGNSNLLIHGDCRDAMLALLPQYEGRIDLIYIDPPYATGGEFGRPEAAGYSDRCVGADYLQMIYERLQLMHRLLAPTGSIYIHLDWRMNCHVRLIMDEIFGTDCFQREIIWRIGWVSGYKSSARNWIRNHDTILFYTRDKREFTFNKSYLPYRDGYRRRDGQKPSGKGWPLEDTWNCSQEDRLDSIQIMSFSGEKTGYPTQKNESLLTRILEASSNPGDLVADFFCGSGTTLAVADKLSRRWIGCDAGEEAVRIAASRLSATGPFGVYRVVKDCRQSEV